jgi:Alpha 1,4-glycosyltransferase conserved region
MNACCRIVKLRPGTQAKCLDDFAEHYNGHTWGNNGPTLLTRAYHEYKSTEHMASHPVTVLPHTAFYPVRVHKIHKAFENVTAEYVHSQLSHLKSEGSYVLHYYNNVVAHLPAQPLSIMDYVFSCMCVLCQCRAAARPCQWHWLSRARTTLWSLSRSS